MKPITLVMRNGVLTPDHDTDAAELAERLGDGEVITTDLKPSVNRKGNAQFWAIINKVQKLDPKRWRSVDELANAAKIAAGHAYLTSTLRGKPIFMARSLAEVEDWDGFIDKVIRKLSDSLGIDERLLRDDGSVAAAPPAPAADPETLSNETKVEDVSDERTQDPDYSPKTYVEKMIALATDPAWNGRLDDQIRQLDAIRAIWMKHLKDLGFGFKVAETAMLVARGKLKAPDAKRLLMAQLPVA